MRRRLAVSLAVLCTVSRAFAQTSQSANPGFHLHWGEAVDPSAAIIGLDHDDDDDNGVPDLVAPPDEDNDVVDLQVEAGTATRVNVRVTGGLRIFTPGGLVEGLALTVSGSRATVRLVGVAVSTQPNDATVVVTAGPTERRIQVTVGALGFASGDNTLLFGHRDALRVSQRVTNDDSLPRRARWQDVSGDIDDLRVELWAPGERTAPRVKIESVGTRGSVELHDGALRGRLAEVTTERPGETAAWRTGFIRLVSDDIDQNAPGVQGQTLRVGMRDRVRAVWKRDGTAGEVSTDLRVMRPGNEEGRWAARAARWNVRVLRDRPLAVGGRPVVGNTDEGAVAIGRRQVSISNEIYLQCGITWGEPAMTSVEVVDPPSGAMVSFGDDDGMTAEGGTLRARVNGRVITVTSRAGWRTVDTAMAFARAVDSAGFRTETTVNPRTEYGAGESVDVLVRDRTGRLATVTAVEANGALSTDRRQRVSLGVVDLSNGLEEFRNLNSASGTLEERTIVKGLADGDPATIDLFVINRFTRATRIGEAFVEGDGGAIRNVLFLDRVGVAAEREAWTQSHEAGHILLDQPWHPDNLGPDRPWLLMDADANLGAVNGPKRFTPDECARIRQRSGVHATPAVLSRYDVVEVSPRAGEFRAWPERALWSRGAVLGFDDPSSTITGTLRVDDRSAREQGIELHGRH